MLPVSILEHIHGHGDLVNLTENQREQLCREIRDYLVESISKTGGHLASNLGVVELTLAIETVFDTASDRLVFDVGHQSYVHKLLTGRQAEFVSLRQFGGLSGFPKPYESEADAFVAGHASSSVSVALGMARARSLQNEKYSVIAMIGDGAATGGMAYEGLSDAAVSKEPMIVILNDNEMSIDKNVGGMASHLSRLRTKEKYVGMKKRYRNVLRKLPGGKFLFRVTRGIKERLRRMLLPVTIFESMGLSYLGPVDGHDTEKLISLLKVAKDMDCPVVLHVLTQKGRGYEPAKANPSQFHGVGKFDPKTGEIYSKSQQTFSDAFGEAMVELAAENEKLCAITAAMPGGTGLLEFKKEYPRRTFDVGIAEEHAVSMAGGLAKQGMVPVVALYSTFLQRSYDMLLQDIAMMNLHVVFAIDRAGLVGEDGETHHGVFDVGFLRQIPGMKVLCPSSKQELRDMLRWAVNEYDGPVAIRYPRGADRAYTDSAWGENTVCCHREGADVALITYGTMLQTAMDAAKILEEQGVHSKVLRLLCVDPLPVEEVSHCVGNIPCAVVLEETMRGCGIREALAWELRKTNPGCRVYGKDLGTDFVTHGSVDKLYEELGLDAQSVANCIQEVRKVEN